MIVVGEQVCYWVAERTTDTYYPNSGVGIGIQKDGRITAGVLFNGYCGRSIQIHVAKEPDAYINREWLFVLFDYAFRQLGVNKIIGIVDSTNEAALRFDKHIGFVEEAVIKDAGKHGDMHVLTMTREQCRFLRKPK